MGEKGSNPLMRRIDDKLMWLYRILPFTGVGLYRRILLGNLIKKKKYTLLDIGCGDGYFTRSLALPANFDIVGVDIFKPYIDLAKKSGVYKKVIKMDARKIGLKKKYDIVIANYIIEHLNKKEGIAFIDKIEKISNQLVIITTPIGKTPQEAYDNNPHQVHKSGWDVKEIQSLGYSVKSTGLKLLWGDKNVVSNYGLFSYFLFLISALATPILRIFPNLGTYMICYKRIR